MYTQYPVPDLMTRAFLPPARARSAAFFASVFRRLQAVFVNLFPAIVTVAGVPATLRRLLALVAPVLRLPLVVLRRFFPMVAIV